MHPHGCGGGGGCAGGGVPLEVVTALSWSGEVSLGGILNHHRCAHIVVHISKIKPTRQFVAFVLGPHRHLGEGEEDNNRILVDRVKGALQR